MYRQRAARGPIDRPAQTSGIGGLPLPSCRSMTGTGAAEERLTAEMLSGGAVWCQAFQGDS